MYTISNISAAAKAGFLTAKPCKTFELQTEATELAKLAAVETSSKTMQFKGNLRLQLSKVQFYAHCTHTSLSTIGWVKFFSWHRHHFDIELAENTLEDFGLWH